MPSATRLFLAPRAFIALTLVTSISQACGNKQDLVHAPSLANETDPHQPASRPLPMHLVAEAWDRSNNPRIVDPWMTKRFDPALLSGRLARTPWSDDYWQSNRAGIAQRWQTPGTDHFRYVPPTLDALKRMSPEEVARLSPAEKYDIARGASAAYPTVRAERLRNLPSAPSWSGLCHGLAPASLNFDEPNPMTIRSPEGIEVRFGSSDIKALLTYYQGEIARIQASPPGSFIGSDKCADDSSLCKGVNAGAFHLALVNEIARHGRGVIIDTSRGKIIWNHPVFAFKARVVGEEASSRPGVAREVLIENVVSYVSAVDAAWAPFGEGRQKVTDVTYRYSLEIDASGSVTGGEWRDEAFRVNPSAIRPDFLWTKQRPVFIDAWKPLEAIYLRSTGR